MIYLRWAFWKGLAWVTRQYRPALYLFIALNFLTGYLIFMALIWLVFQ